MAASFVRRVTERLQAPPPWLRWIEQCDPLVLDAYHAMQRRLATRQLPLVAGVCLAGIAMKAFGVVPVGHPATVALYALGLAALLWPASVARLAREAWRASSGASVPRSRLRLFAVATGALAVLSSLLIAAVAGLAVMTALL